MSRLRVLMTKRFFEEDLEYVKSRLSPEIDLLDPSEYTPAGVAAAVAEDVHVLLGDMVTREILDAAPSLRLIQIPWTGVDRLNVDLLRQYHVPVCNSHSNALAVAEMSVGLMLAITKKIPLHDARMRHGQWMRPQRSVPDSHIPPTILSGKTAGFVGFGAIAQQTARLLSGFAMHLMATTANPQRPRSIPIDTILPPAGLYELADRSDLVFVAVPLVPGTRNLIDSGFFSHMKPSAYLVNTSRGEVVDEAALYTALAEKRIAGAAIDTWYQYPTADRPETFPSARFPFHELDNLVLSPHRAGFVEGDLPHLVDVVTNLNRLAAGEPLINRVDLEQGF